MAEKSKAQDAFDEELKQQADVYSILYSQIGDAEREVSSYADLVEADEIASSKSLGRFQAGVGSISDALLAQVELVESKKNYAIAKNRVDNLKQRLLILIYGNSVLNEISG